MTSPKENKTCWLWFNHNWEILQITSLKETESSLPWGRLYTLQCVKCGNIKYKEVS